MPRRDWGNVCCFRRGRLADWADRLQLRVRSHPSLMDQRNEARSVGQQAAMGRPPPRDGLLLRAWVPKLLFLQELYRDNILVLSRRLSLCQNFLKDDRGLP